MSGTPDCPSPHPVIIACARWSLVAVALLALACVVGGMLAGVL